MSKELDGSLVPHSWQNEAAVGWDNFVNANETLETNLMNIPYTACIIQNPLRECGLSRINVSRNADVSLKLEELVVLFRKFERRYWFWVRISGWKWFECNSSGSRTQNVPPEDSAPGKLA